MSEPSTKEFKTTQNSPKEKLLDSQPKIPQLPQKQPSKGENKQNDTQNSENFDKTKIKLQHNLTDLMAKDNNKRTLLHRAALNQNSKLLKEVIDDYITILDEYNENIGQGQEMEIKPLQLKEFINAPDKFGNTPLLNACSLKSQSGSKREECLSLLLKHEADINAKNKRTLWNAMHWMAYHGEFESAKILLVNNISVIEPDFQGYYALDIAGKQNKPNKPDNEVGILLIDHLIDLFKNIYDKMNDETGEADYPEDPHLHSPLLKTSILFWSVKYGKECFDINTICKWLTTYIESPMYLMNSMTAIHAAAQMAKDDILILLTDKIVKKNDILLKYIEKKGKNINNFSFNPEFNEIFSIASGELKKYDAKFLQNIKNFAKWIFDYERQIILKENTKLWADEPDLYGNTPLHLASITGHESCLRILINFGCDPDKINHEGFRPHELIQNLKTKRDILKMEIQCSHSFEAEVKPKIENKKIKAMENRMKSEIKKKIENILMKEKNMRIKKNAILSKKTKVSDLIDKMMQYPVKIPEFVIRFHKKPEGKKEKSEGLIFEKDDKNANRINFYISLFINAKFDVYLAPSIDENFYYVMLSLNQEELYHQCHNLKMRLKLIDSYNYEIYEHSKYGEQEKKEYRGRFEPLRSIQRQEIIFKKVKKIIDLQMLKKQKLVEDYFMMHSLSGIERIRKKWIVNPKWYWPQPFSQISDYLKEGKFQNFESLTFLKQYLGEKISFYFAWRSFSTCFMVPLAIPGMAFQIYISYYENYHSQILPFWVFFVSLYSTIMVEFWKRKCSEINTRWGSLDLMNDDSWTKEFRTEFSGDECVNSVSLQITKINPTNMTLGVFLISIPVLIVLLALCVLTYLITKQYKKELGSTVSGLINGIVISLLNIAYTALTRWFVDKENHKVQKDHENSLISKSFTFQILNSFFTIFVIGFFEPETDFKDLFTTLWPILIYNKASSLFLNVFFPWLKYKFYQWRYFSKIMKKAADQKISNDFRSKNKEQQKVVDPSNNQPPEERDKIIDFANYNDLDYTNYWERVVLFFHLDDKKLSELQAKEISSLHDIDLDQVELNSHRSEYIDTVDFYSEGFITFAYVTMFTAAFPIGPVIALIVDTVELKWKIFWFLYAIKRPIIEKSTGIGMWLDIWELLSIVSVFSNFLLLFFQPKVKFNVFYEIDETHAKENQELQRLWLVIILVAIILILKFVFRALIPDKPKWVIDEEERQKVQKEIFTVGEENFSPVKIKKEKIEDRSRKEMKMQNQINRLQKELNEIKESLKPKKDTAIALPPLSQSQISNPQEFKAKTLSLFYKTFKYLEHELLIKRMNDINKQEGNDFFLCNECHKFKALLECLDCQELFCDRCYKEVHLKSHRILFGPESKPNTVSLTPYTPAIENFENILKENNQSSFYYKNRKSRMESDNLSPIRRDNPSFFNLKPIEKLKKENENMSPSHRDSTQRFLNREVGNMSPSQRDRESISRNLFVKEKEKKLQQKKWKKFEYFCLPTYEKNTFYPSLIKILNTFCHLYCQNNSLREGNYSENLEISDFQFEQLQDQKKDIKASYKDGPSSKNKQINEFEKIDGKFLKIKNINMIEILENEDFNIEDKLFLNRLAFMGFRKLGYQITIQDFLKYCQKLQDGKPYQKRLLFVKMIEIGDEIEKNDVIDFMLPSLLRCIGKSDFKCDQVISKIFDEKNTLKKAEFWAEINNPNNSEFKEMMDALMQIR